MNYRVSFEGKDLGTVHLEDGKTLVAIADEYHRTLLEEVFEQVREGYNFQWDVQLFNSALRTLEKEGYLFTPLHNE
jgi:hypothetical protein